jgi:hypothetical protein
VENCKHFTGSFIQNLILSSHYENQKKVITFGFILIKIQDYVKNQNFLCLENQLAEP